MQLKLRICLILNNSQLKVFYLSRKQRQTSNYKCRIWKKREESADFLQKVIFVERSSGVGMRSQTLKQANNPLIHGFFYRKESFSVSYMYKIGLNFVKKIKNTIDIDKICVL